MQPSHTLSAVSVRFDDPNLVSTSGLVPVLAAFLSRWAKMVRNTAATMRHPDRHEGKRCGRCEMFFCFLEE